MRAEKLQNKPLTVEMATLLVDLQDAGTRVISCIEGTGYRWWRVEDSPRRRRFRTATVEGLRDRGALLCERCLAPKRPGERPYVVSYTLGSMRKDVSDGGAP